MINLGPIDNFLNSITMYRLVLLYAGGLIAAAFGFGFSGMVAADPASLAFSSAIILASGYAANRLFAALWRVPVNAESIWITAFILILVMPAPAADDIEGIMGLVLASTAAMASKFVLAIGRRHIFNPVAVGAAASYLLLDQPATWWAAGNLVLLPFVLIGGLLVVRKVQRFEMTAVFIAANLIAAFLTDESETLAETIDMVLVYSPVLFAAFAMLTEPLTAPQTRPMQFVFAILAGVLTSPNIVFGEFSMTPEFGFLAANAFAWAVSGKRRYRLTLVTIEKLASGCYDYVFKPDHRLRFKPGQYLDWTLGLRNPDDRGNRRPFTIASSPSEALVRLGVKFYPRPSAFKQALLDMKPGDVIYASHVAGSFILPSRIDEKLAFLAGGIGITPFRSMVQDMLDRREPRDAVMLYGVNRSSEIAYAGIFGRAERELGLRTVYAVKESVTPGMNMRQGFIDAQMIRSEVPDYHERTFYLSGPRAMVIKFQSVLKGLGVPHARIRTDYFPGFA